MDQFTCFRIPHPKLTTLGNTNAICSYCYNKWAHIGSEWHSNNCFIVIDLGVLKQRCIKCSRSHSNICPARHLRFFPETKRLPLPMMQIECPMSNPLPQLVLSSSYPWIQMRCGSASAIYHHSLMETHICQATTGFYTVGIVQLIPLDTGAVQQRLYNILPFID